MITFKSFLTEKTKVISKWDKKEIDVKSMIDLLNANCKDGLKAIAKGQVFYRGDKSFNGKNQFVIDTADSVRTSRDSNNLYNLMMDASTALREFPKRTNSITVSSDIYTAGGYGEPYVIFPYDGTKIAISAIDDFLNNEIENDFIHNLQTGELSRLLATALSLVGFKSRPKYTNIQEIDSHLSSIDSFAFVLAFAAAAKTFNYGTDELFTKDGYKAFIPEWRFSIKPAKTKLDASVLSNIGNKLKSILDSNPSKKFTALSSALMTPDSLDIKLVTYGQKFDLGHDNELWFSGKCVAISLPLFLKILDKMNALGMSVSYNLHATISARVDEDYAD